MAYDHACELNHSLIYATMTIICFFLFFSFINSLGVFYNNESLFSPFFCFVFFKYLGLCCNFKSNWRLLKTHSKVKPLNPI